MHIRRDPVYWEGALRELEILGGPMRGV